MSDFQEGAQAQINGNECVIVGTDPLLVRFHADPEATWKVYKSPKADHLVLLEYVEEGPGSVAPGSPGNSCA